MSRKSSDRIKAVVKRRAPHVLFRFTDGALHCTRCGEVYKIAPYCLVDVFVATAEAYADAHEYCQERER